MDLGPEGLINYSMLIVQLHCIAHMFIICCSLFQKTIIILHSPKRCTIDSLCMPQKLHFSDWSCLNLDRDLLVVKILCIILYWSQISLGSAVVAFNFKNFCFHSGLSFNISHFATTLSIPFFFAATFLQPVCERNLSCIGG